MSQFTSLFTGDDTDESPDELASVAPYCIMMVDDEPNVLSALKRIFHHENYQIVTASNGQQALDLLAQHPCQLLISDFKMPIMNGGELMRRTKKLYPDMIRIMLTGHADADAVISAVKEGAVYKFILKPWNGEDLRVTVGLALEQYDLRRRNKQLVEQNRQTTKELNTLAKLAITNRSQLAILLHKRHLLSDRQVQEIYKIQQSKKLSPLHIILERDWVSEQEIRTILKQELMVEEVSLAEFQIDPGVLALIPRKICESQLVLPLKLRGKTLMLVMADPMDKGLIEDLRFSIGLNIESVMANVKDIRHKMVELFGEQQVDFTDLESLVGDHDPIDGIEIIIDDEDEGLTIEELLRDSDEPPAIRLANLIILEAVRLGASDIHIHPRTKTVVVRYRIDGILTDKIQIPHSLHASIISRIKVMAELDITERRKPQDGRITVKTPMRIIDLRISSLPTINGEKLVMRILDRNATIHSIENLGLAPAILKQLQRVNQYPQGIILATGPTGSGKTTTLYSLLQHQATPEKNYLTIEDPVEYYLDMAGQVMIKEKMGLDFATVLRAMMRQDPDVILLGEIRDTDTAEVAFHAALTGHIVLSTLHTNSAIATIARLFDLGLKPYVLSTALSAIISQRLVRKLCEHCKQPYEVDAELLEDLGPLFQQPQLQCYHGVGCHHCNQSGYAGRIGLYELLVPDEEMRLLIEESASVGVMSKLTTQQGMHTILHDARLKVEQGLTSVDEIMRVLGPQ